MAASNTEFEVPTWIAGVVISFVLASIFYVFIYGGDATTPGLVALGLISLGFGLFTLYLFYRFVVAVEKIADKY